MKVTLIMSVVGIFFTWVFGFSIFDWSFFQIFWFLICVNIAFFGALWLTLFIQSYHFLQRIFLGSILRAWVFFACIYASVILMLCAPVRSVSVFMAFLIPGLMSSGPAIFIFGCIRDYTQRRAVIDFDLKNLLSRPKIVRDKP